MEAHVRPGRVALASVAAIALIVPSACGDSSDDAGPRHTVRVDYRHDEFGSHYWRFFPRTVAAHPGDTVVFHQQWTGEPHMVTLGTLVEQVLDAEAALEEKYHDLDPEAEPERAREAEAEFAAATAGLPRIDPYVDTDRAQTVLQPCYLERGTPPADVTMPCTPAQQRKPAFNGRQTYYNSGFIPFEGSPGNRFQLPLAADLAPGKYRYVCTIHLPDMQGVLDVRPKTAPLPSQGALDRRALAEIEELAGPLRIAERQAAAGRATAFDTPLGLPLGGYHSHEQYTVAIDAFYPSRITTRVGAPVTWKIVGAHTVSFDVPRYLPIFIVDKDGRVRRNPKVDRPIGGAPAIPPVDFTAETYEIDGGTWDGSDFYSSGLLGSEPFSTFTLRFSKPGTYSYACLIHPPMVGKVVVRP